MMNDDDHDDGTAFAVPVTTPSPRPSPHHTDNDLMFRIISGSAAGAAAAVATAPLDLIKTRQQVEHVPLDQQKLLRVKPQHVSFWGSLKATIKHEGHIGLFKGLGTTLLGLVPNWAIYWASYGYFIDKLDERDLLQSHKIECRIAAAVGAGVITTFLTSPIWLVKVRLQTQSMHKRRYDGILHTFRTVYKEESFQGFYKGLSASLLGVSHVAIQFPLYEGFKDYMHETYDDGSGDGDQSPSYATLILTSSISKVIAGTLTYPHEVLRSRLQRQRIRRHYHGVWHGARKIVAQEGFSALYKGLPTNLLRVVPSCAITFTTFEKVFHYLQVNHGNGGGGGGGGRRA